MSGLFLLFEIGIPNLTVGCIPLRQNVMYIHNLCMTLNFDLYVGGMDILSKFTYKFYLVVNKHICNRNFGDIIVHLLNN